MSRLTEKKGTVFENCVSRALRYGFSAVMVGGEHICLGLTAKTANQPFMATLGFLFYILLPPLFVIEALIIGLVHLNQQKQGTP